jgi:glycosyltransferase involved in cell wall biosynthesis
MDQERTRDTTVTLERSPNPSRSPIRVVYGLDTLQVGGTELNAVRTAERLDPARFALSVVHLHRDGPLLERYRAAGIQTHHWPIPNLYSPRTWRQGLALARFLRRERIQIFQSHDIYCNIFGVPWARIAGVPVVIAARRWFDAIPRPAQRHVNRIANRFAHRILANSQAVARMLSEQEGVAPHRVISVPNFVGEEAFRPVPDDVRARLRANWGVPADALVVGVSARLAAVKDHRTLISCVPRLAASFENLHVLLIGDGPERTSLQALAQSPGCADRVHFAGEQTGSWNLQALFDVSVLCSLSEGFPNSLVEAMAAGRPVVATDVGGNRDAVDPGRTGTLVPPGDAEALTQALRALLADPARRLLIGEMGRRVARERFHADAVIEGISQLYESLVDEAGHTRRRDPRPVGSNR